MVVFFGSKKKRLSAALCLFGLSYCAAKELLSRKSKEESKFNKIIGRIDYLDSKLDDLSKYLKSKKK